MADIIAFGAEHMDYDAAMDEIELLVPKYLDAIDLLEGVKTFEDIPLLMKNAEVYWDRLAYLFTQVRGLDQGMQLKEIVSNALRAELRVLEKVYVALHNRICMPSQNWTEMMWRSADMVLLRMDRILAGLGFGESDEDRRFVAEMMAKNLVKRRERAGRLAG